MIKTIFASACLAAPALAQPDLLNNLPEADVVFLGEVHDNPAHHENQTIATQAIGRSGSAHPR